MVVSPFTIRAVPTLERLGVAEVRAIAVTFGRLLREHQDRLNRLNVYPVPDGDTGTNMARTLDAVTAEIDALGSDAQLEEVCHAIAHGSLMGARGNSGVIVSQILRGATRVVAEAGGLGPEQAAQAFRAAATAAYGAVMKPVEGTILTVVRCAAEGAEAAVERGASLAGVLVAARDHAAEAVERTPDLLPVLREAGVVDAGGAGLVLFFDAALHVADGRPLPDPPRDLGGVDAVAAAVQARAGAAGVDGAMTNRYEVMYFLVASDDAVPGFKDRWAAIGDSIVVVGGDGLWNCHVHTDDIGAAIEVGIQVGRPERIRVTDLASEVAEEHTRREAAMGSSRVRVATAVVAVSVGEGLNDLFGDLGVQELVIGGQTLNPSTAELLAAVERAPSDAVVVLPNNKNIIVVAEQLDALTAKTVRVVPTRSMPEALGALVVYDPEGPLEANVVAMEAARAQVRSGSLTRAVRDSSVSGRAIAAGSWIGIDRDEGIVAVGAGVEEALIGLLDAVVDDEAGLVTVITGEGSTDSVTARIRAWVAQHRPGVEVEVHAGGQPLYPYLLGVE